MYGNLLHVAEKCFQQFVEEYIDIFGMDSVSSNVHGIIHLVDDVRRFGILPDNSTYPFENALQKIKKKCSFWPGSINSSGQTYFRIN